MDGSKRVKGEQIRMLPPLSEDEDVDDIIRQVEIFKGTRRKNDGGRMRSRSGAIANGMTATQQQVNAGMARCATGARTIHTADHV